MQKSKEKKAQPKGQKQSDGKKKVASINSSRLQTSTKPKISKTKNGCRISHREFLGDIIGQNLFADGIYKFNVNPGMMGPWIKTQAAGWEQYRYHRLKFTLVKRSPTTRAGSVLMVMDYNPYDAPPESETQMSSYSGCAEDSIFETLEYTVDKEAYHAGSSRKFVRDSLPPPGDLRSYDGGNLFVATSGDSSSGTLSHKLWVEYDVEFFVPETDGSPVAVGHLDSRSTVETKFSTTGLTPSLEIKLPMGEIKINGIEAKLAANGDLLIPKGIYRYLLNTSATADNGGGSPYNDVFTELALYVNGIKQDAASKAGTRIRNGNTHPNSQAENTTQGVFTNSVDDGIVHPSILAGNTEAINLNWSVPALATTLYLMYIGKAK